MLLMIDLFNYSRFSELDALPDDNKSARVITLPKTPTTGLTGCMIISEDASLEDLPYN